MGNALVDIPLPFFLTAAMAISPVKLKISTDALQRARGMQYHNGYALLLRPFADSATQRFLSSQNITTVTVLIIRQAALRQGVIFLLRLTTGKPGVIYPGEWGYRTFGQELSNQSWQTGTENEYLVYR